MTEDAGKARKGRKRRNRRSLRVPVDEVPRPTVAASPEAAEVPVEDGGATVEIPAYVEGGSPAPLDDLPPAPSAEALDEELLGKPRQDAAEPLEGEPTVAQEPPSEDDLDEAPTLVRASERPPSDPSVEVELDSESVELDLDAADDVDEFDEPATLVQPPPSDTSGAAAEAKGGPAEDAAVPPSRADSDPVGGDDAGDDAGDEGGSAEDGSADADAGVADGAAEAEASDRPQDEEGGGVRATRDGAAAAIDDPDSDPELVVSNDDDDDDVVAPSPPPAVQVVVSRVVQVIGTDSVPPPPPEPEPALERTTLPGDEFDLEEDDGDALADFDVYVDEADDDGAPELSDDEAAALLEEEADGAERKRPSKPPPPPSNQKAPAPPPPPEKAEPPAPVAERAAKPKRKWWEHLFNDDYLRTVPIPHPKVVRRQCDFIEQRFGLARGATILDVGCGLGVHAVELTRRGFLVVGLDLSLPMLSRAADEAQEHGFKINFLHADMRDMNFDGAFDAVLCWGTTFGYFDDETNKQVVERLHQALKPRGLLLLDVVNRDYVVRSQPNLVWFEGDGCVVMEETNVNYITSRLRVKRNVILDDGRQRDTRYTVRLYALHELGQMLHNKGFRVVEVSGREAHPGVYFGADSPRLIILAQRRPQARPVPPSQKLPTVPSEPPGQRSEPPSAETLDPDTIDAEALEDAEPLDPDSPSEAGEAGSQDAGALQTEAEPEPPSQATAAALAEALEQSEGELDSQELELPEDADELEEVDDVALEEDD